MNKLLLAACLSTVVASAAHGGTTFAYNRSAPINQNPAGGTISSIASTYDTDSKVFTWNVEYSDGVAANTQGYWLVVSGGPNPKSQAGQLAIIYFDARSLASPNVSIYRYNGENNQNSFQTPGDLLASTRNSTASQITASASQSGGRRTFNLSVNASAINARYNAGNGFPDWEGIQYGDRIGVWFHSVASLTTSYNGSELTGFSGRIGWYDTDNETTTKIPTPGAAALLGLGGLLATRRRRA